MLHRLATSSYSHFKGNIIFSPITQYLVKKYKFIIFLYFSKSKEQYHCVDIIECYHVYRACKEPNGIHVSTQPVQCLFELKYQENYIKDCNCLDNSFIELIDFIVVDQQFMRGYTFISDILYYPTQLSIRSPGEHCQSTKMYREQFTTVQGAY